MAAGPHCRNGDIRQLSGEGGEAQWESGGGWWRAVCSVVISCIPAGFGSRAITGRGCAVYLIGFPLSYCSLDGFAPRVTSQPTWADSDATWASISSGRILTFVAAFWMWSGEIGCSGSR